MAESTGLMNMLSRFHLNGKGIIWGLYGHSGKENGNYYSGLYRVLGLASWL